NYHRYLVLPTLMSDGFIYSHIKVGGYNGEDFCLWLEQLMDHMQPYLAPRSVLVIDNCCIYHIPNVEAICE
ncbi:hypothetical protein K438DRAFT_1432111, partial [Mycena galopus ATCC 62051]